MFLFRVKYYLILFAVLLLLTVQTQVRAQNTTEPDKEEVTYETGDDWSVSFTPYAWFAAQSSDVGSVNLRQSFNDLASITNLGFQGRIIVQWRRIFFAADWTHAKMGSATNLGRTSIDMDLKQNILDMKLGTILYDSTSSKQDGGIRVLAGVGARYWDNQVDLTITTQPILPGTPETVDMLRTGQSWWDPAVEVGLQFPVTSKVGFQVLATGGGLGIGNASKYMWDATFAAYFRLSRRLTIPAGYRVFKYDRIDGSGDDEVRQTVTVSGPFIGLRIALF